jgi:hypothetical protein
MHGAFVEHGAMLVAPDNEMSTNDKAGEEASSDEARNICFAGTGADGKDTPNVEYAGIGASMAADDDKARNMVFEIVEDGDDGKDKGSD